MKLSSENRLMIVGLIRRSVTVALIALLVPSWPKADPFEPMHDEMPVESHADLGVRCDLAYTAYIAIRERDGARSRLRGDLAERYRGHRKQIVIRSAVYLAQQMGLDPGDPASVAPAQEAYHQRFVEISEDFKRWLTQEAASGRDVFAAEGLILSDIKRCEALFAVWSDQD